MLAGFGDEFFWGLFDVVFVAKTGLESVDFLAEFQDAVFEVMFVLFENLGWNLEIDVVVCDSKTETRDSGLVNLRYARGLCEMLNEQLVGIHELVVVEGDWVGLGTWEILEMAADIGDDVDELVEALDLFGVDLVWGRPLGVDDHAFGPAEGLPDGFSDEWSEWMEHDKDLLESGFEQWGVFPEFFAFEEPVGVFVPDEVIDEVAGFGKTIVVEELLELLVGLVDLVADPIFAVTGADDFFIGRIVVDEVLDEARDVPEFVAEVTAGNDGVFAEGLIHAGGAAS